MIGEVFSMDTQAESSSRRVRWDDSDWEQFAGFLDEANPAQRFPESEDLIALTVAQLQAASARMSQPRPLRSLVGVREKVLEAYARMRARAAAPAEAAVEATAETAVEAAVDHEPASAPQQFRRAPAPAEPPSPLKLDGEGRPLPVPEAERVTRPEKKAAPADPFRAIAWTRDEWLAIATELDRLYQGANYPNRLSLAGLTSEDVAFAQRVLPLERQIRHVKVASFSTLRPALVDAFEEIGRKRAADEAEKKALEIAGEQTRIALERVAAAAAQPPAAAPGANPFEAAFAPMLNLVLGHLVDRLRPVIAELINDALLAPAPAAAQAELAQALAPAMLHGTARAPAADMRKLPKMRIGIVGNLTTYKEDLSREFPTMEFTCVTCDELNRLEAVKNCERVIVLTKFCNHAAMKKVRKSLNEGQFMPLHGCLSDMRRVLTGWAKDWASKQGQAVAA
jgi:hypothetical protein